MPIEIRELVIRTEIDPTPSQTIAPASQGNTVSDELIQEIVDKVVAVIKTQNER